ncbi:MAG: ATP-binding cassette domain-containing protein [Balneolales bacterium]|nr:ATP-binding cassette domain-containing protein [Balneolales bacterium]
MLKFENVVKKFAKVKAVDDLSFEIKKGEIFALLGPNGAGKTSSIRMIMQIMEPDSGLISFDSSVLLGSKVNRSKLGYLPEERGLYQDAPIMKTLLYLSSLRGSDPAEAQKKATAWLDRFGILDRKAEKISTLSKGNQQKVQFIASILHEPEFAILDEPYSGFDPINQELISDIIRELRDGGMTILLSAHQMQLVENIADRILMINHGKELLSGTFEDIRNNTISDKKLIVSYNGAAKKELFESSAHIRNSIQTAPEEWEIYFSENYSLNEVLKIMIEAGTVKSLKTSDVNLHEIFIESFKTGGRVHE